MLTALVLSALTASGSTSDDFESATLGVGDAPPGRWDQVYAQNGVPLPLLSSLAARRGGTGVRFNDTHSGSSEGTENQLALSETRERTTYYGRAWFRFGTMSANGTNHIFGVNGRWDSGFGSNGWGLFGVRVTVPGYGLGADIFEDSGAYRVFPADATATVPPGEWHLLELELTGLRSSNGCLRVARDGVEVMPQQCGLGLTHVGASNPGLGFRWQSPWGARGVLDVDDVYFGETLRAARVALAASVAVAAVSDCVAVRAQLSVAWGVAAPSAFDEDVPVSVTGPGALFSDAACTLATAVLPVRAGASDATLYVKPLEAGEVQLTAAPLSLVLTGPQARVQVAAGPPSMMVTPQLRPGPVPTAPGPDDAAPREDYEVGWGCTHGGGAVPLLLLLLALRVRRAALADL